MKDELIDMFEDILDNESEKIVSKIIKNQSLLQTNKTFKESVESLIKKEYKAFSYEIQLRANKFIPKNFTLDENHKLVNKYEYNKEKLYKYAQWCKNDIGDKDHRKVSKKMAKNLIDFYKQNPKNRKNLIEIVSDLSKKYFDNHYDSVDIRTVILFLQEEIEQYGYTVISIKPFRIIHN